MLTIDAIYVLQYKDLNSSTTYVENLGYKRVSFGNKIVKDNKKYFITLFYDKVYTIDVLDSFEYLKRFENNLKDNNIIYYSYILRKNKLRKLL